VEAAVGFEVDDEFEQLESAARIVIECSVDEFYYARGGMGKFDDLGFYISDGERINAASFGTRQAERACKRTTARGFDVSDFVVEGV
jgi:hypothetical protein